MCAVYANRQLFLSFIAWCLIGAFLSQIESVYTAIGQEPEVAKLATRFVHTTFPFHLFEVCNNVFSSNFASAQRVTHYGAITLSIATVAHGLMSYYFVFVLDWDFDGVCWATGLMFMLRGTIGVSLVKFGGRFPTHDDVYLFSRETVSNLWPLLKIDLQVVAMGVWGWWAFDIFTLMATYLGPDQVGAQTIMRSIGLWSFMMPVGFAFACGIYFNNNLGEGRPQVCMQYYNVALVFALMVTVIQITAFYFGME